MCGGFFAWDDIGYALLLDVISNIKKAGPNSIHLKSDGLVVDVVHPSLYAYEQVVVMCRYEGFTRLPTVSRRSRWIGMRIRYLHPIKYSEMYVAICEAFLGCYPTLHRFRANDL